MRKDLCGKILIGLIVGVLSFNSEVKGITQATHELNATITYEETISPHRSNVELYQEYHLLIITSLEEAEKTLTDDQYWALRMTQNAYNYLQLLSELLTQKVSAELKELFPEFENLINYLKKYNLTEIKKGALKTDLRDLAKLLKQEYNLNKINLWLKK